MMAIVCGCTAAITVRNACTVYHAHNVGLPSVHIHTGSVFVFLFDQELCQ